MKNRQAGHNQALSAAKAGISIRSGRRIEKGEKPDRETRHWKTREDPLAAVWESELAPLLENEPTLSGITLWDYLDEKYPGQYPETCLRTLQRRVKHWLATRGPQKAVMFRQSVPAGHQGLSDFTHPNTAITVAGEPFKHLLYQFCLAHWVGDITYIRHHGGWSYLATVLDLGSRGGGVGYALSQTPDAQLARQALLNAIKMQAPDTLQMMFHSDQGVQYNTANNMKNHMIFHALWITQ